MSGQFPMQQFDENHFHPELQEDFTQAAHDLADHDQFLNGARTRGKDIANKTSFSAVSTWEDWGSSLNAGNPGEEVFITADLTGSIFTASGVSRAGRVRVGISTDGGSTYTFGPENWCAADGTLRRDACCASHEVHSVTPTSDIHVKVQALISGGSTTDMDFVTGHVTVNISPS